MALDLFASLRSIPVVTGITNPEYSNGCNRFGAFY